MLEKCKDLKIILGSASPWRARVLKNAGYVFTTMTADIDENKICSADPKKLALDIAKAKTKKLLKKIQGNAILITADQVVSCGGNIYGKPRSPEEASKFLSSYAKYPATTVSALVVTNTFNNKQAFGVDVVNICFSPIPDAVIDGLIKDGEIFKCAGGFQIEGDNDLIAPFVISIDGTVDSIKGMPLMLLARLLKKVGYTKCGRE